MDTAPDQKGSSRWVLALFAALPLPFYAVLLVLVLLGLPGSSYAPSAIDYAITALFASGPAYALVLQLLVVRALMRREPPLVNLGRRIALLNMRILFCLCIGAWLPWWECILFAYRATGEFYGWNDPAVLYSAVISGLAMLASVILLRGTWTVVRKFTAPGNPDVKTQPSTAQPPMTVVN